MQKYAALQHLVHLLVFLTTIINRVFCQQPTECATTRRISYVINNKLGPYICRCEVSERCLRRIWTISLRTWIRFILAWKCLSCLLFCHRRVLIRLVVHTPSPVDTGFPDIDPHRTGAQSTPYFAPFAGANHPSPPHLMYESGWSRYIGPREKLTPPPLVGTSTQNRTFHPWGPTNRSYVLTTRHAASYKLNNMYCLLSSFSVIALSF